MPISVSISGYVTVLASNTLKRSRNDTIFHTGEKRSFGDMSAEIIGIGISSVPVENRHLHQFTLVILDLPCARTFRIKGVLRHVCVKLVLALCTSRSG